MRRSLLFSFFLFVGCSAPAPKFEGFDKEIWKNDFKGCKGARVRYLKPLTDQREKLKGLSELDLITVLGNPDETNLSEHHNKVYKYYIEPSFECKGDSATTVLEVRFNATGVSREVAILAID